MTENEVTAKFKEWETAGFKFIGNGTENNDDDPNECPACGSANLFWSLWEHPTRTRPTEEGSEYKPLLLNSINHCYDCDEWWIDEDKAE